MKLYFFKAPWCSACHAIEQHVPSDFEHIDCDASPELATKYNILTLPMFVAVREDGTEIAKIQTTSMPALQNWLKHLEE